MIDINNIVLLITFLWTIFQQYKINKMCQSCIFRNGNNENIQLVKKENKKIVS